MPNPKKVEKFDWDELKKIRDKQWIQMWQDFADEGITPVDLWENGAPHFTPEEGEYQPRIALLPIQKDVRGMVIVCAGGGFMFKSFNEAKPVAEYLHAKGMNAAVLDYRLQPHTQLESCADGLRAVKYLRYHAEKLGIDPNKIAIGGFSAGGMLSGMVATRFDYGVPESDDPIERVSSRPDAALLLYGAFTSSKSAANWHYDPAAQREAVERDNSKHLRQDSPPFFIFQTHGDDPRMAMLFGIELGDRGIPFEVHTFIDGPHGGGLYNGEQETPNVPHTARWAELAAEWLTDMGF